MPPASGRPRPGQPGRPGPLIQRISSAIWWRIGCPQGPRPQFRVHCLRPLTAPGTPIRPWIYRSKPVSAVVVTIGPLHAGIRWSPFPFRQLFLHLPPAALLWRSVWDPARSDRLAPRGSRHAHRKPVALHGRLPDARSPLGIILPAGRLPPLSVAVCPTGIATNLPCGRWLRVGAGGPPWPLVNSCWCRQGEPGLLPPAGRPPILPCRYLLCWKHADPPRRLDAAGQRQSNAFARSRIILYGLGTTARPVGPFADVGGSDPVGNGSCAWWYAMAPVPRTAQRAHHCRALVRVLLGVSALPADFDAQVGTLFVTMYQLEERYPSLCCPFRMSGVSAATGKSFFVILYDAAVAVHHEAKRVIQAVYTHLHAQLSMTTTAAIFRRSLRGSGAVELGEPSDHNSSDLAPATNTVSAVPARREGPETGAHEAGEEPEDPPVHVGGAPPVGDRAPEPEANPATHTTEDRRNPSAPLPAADASRLPVPA